MRTKIGIVYVLSTGEVRRIIVPDADHQLAAHAKVNFDEGFHVEPYTGPSSPSLAEINAILQRRTGKMLT